MITIAAAAVYSMKGEIAHEITYSNGTKVRAVESTGNIIRKECMIGGEWKMSGKPYVVNRNIRRNAEWMVQTVKKFLAN